MFETFSWKLSKFFKNLSYLKSRPAVFWNVTPCILVEVYRRFGGVLSLHFQGRDCRSSSNKRWRYRQYVSPKCRENSTGVNGATFEKTKLHYALLRRNVHGKGGEGLYEIGLKWYLWSTRMEILRKLDYLERFSCITYTRAGSVRKSRKYFGRSCEGDPYPACHLAFRAFGFVL
jgi:hypothetical protein